MTPAWSTSDLTICRKPVEGKAKLGGLRMGRDRRPEPRQHQVQTKDEVVS